MRHHTSWAVDRKLTHCDNPALILLFLHKFIFFFNIYIVLPPAYAVLV